jgi:hypothetical protein
LECGVDLVEARAQLRRELQENSVATRLGMREGRRVAPTTPAAAGQVSPGETSEATRLRIFDRQEAKRLDREATHCAVFAVISLIVGLGLLLGGGLVLERQGCSQIAALDLTALSRLLLEIQPGIIPLALLTTGLSAALIAVGLWWRYRQSKRAIRQVTLNRRPDIVSFNLPLQIGLLILVVSLPPVGAVVGLVLRLERDQDIRRFGLVMIWIGAALILGLVLLNALDSFTNFLGNASGSMDLSTESYGGS